ncbi:hypothetical protein I7I51_06258 [Histoplasma capsulatum]|uniref:Uncharacterized protein n=1 Tax=Ajellomyces capsulatus TaxID=5037 RepID=A0A8A1MHR5_AJECA|nr:hypothetical protein I7I51_06258 [Histoplasma capsulatum]
MARVNCDDGASMQQREGTDRPREEEERQKRGEVAAVVDDSAQEQTGSGLMTSGSTDKLFNHQGIDQASQSKLFSRGLSLFITTICNNVVTCPPRSIPTATPIDHSGFDTD